jgi:hypothetical protein
MRRTVPHKLSLAYFQALRSCCQAIGDVPINRIADVPPAHAKRLHPTVRAKRLRPTVLTPVELSYHVSLFQVKHYHCLTKPLLWQRCGFVWSHVPFLTLLLTFS